MTQTITLPEGTTAATISFDRLLSESWDGQSEIYSNFPVDGRGDGIALTIDGQEIAFSAMTNATASSPSGTIEVNGTTVAYTMTRSTGGNLYGVPGYTTSFQDAVWSVTLTATTPPPGGFSLGIDGTSN